MALEIFSREGCRGTSPRKIARACCLSLPGLMHYFDSKEDLLAAILKRRDQNDFARSHADGSDPFATLSTVMRHNAEVPGLVQLHATLSAASDPSHPAHGFFVDSTGNSVAHWPPPCLIGRQPGELAATPDRE